MTVSPRLRRALALTLRITIVAMIVGAGFGFVLTSYAPRSLATGAGVGLLTAVPLSLFEFVVVSGPLGDRLRRAPFAALLAMRGVVYVAVVLGGYVAGRALAGGFERAFIVDRTFAWSLGFSLLFGVTVNFVMLVRRLAGAGVIAHFVLGRYNTPRPERRALLFLDIVNSTGFAERIGPARFHALLNRVMFDVAGTVLEAGGEIHKYVGDEVIVTWPAPAAGVDPRPGACLGQIFDRLDRRSADYAASFGAPVRLRAGLHVGEVVTGELGDLRQEIAMLGDGMNTAARLVDAARDSGDAAVATSGSVDPARLPAGWRARPLGAVTLRGKTAAVELVALERAG